MSRLKVIKTIWQGEPVRWVEINKEVNVQRKAQDRG